MALRIKHDQSLLLVVDIQEKLAGSIPDSDLIIHNTSRLIKGAQQFDLPVVISEQYPKGIGHSVEPLAKQFQGAKVFEKMTFSCLMDHAFADGLAVYERKQVVITGMETHVCVLQTALDLIENGYQVFVVADAVGSRTRENRDLGLDRMKQAGCVIVSSEMVLFEWLEMAGSADFKAMLPLIK